MAYPYYQNNQYYMQNMQDLQNMKERIDKQMQQMQQFNQNQIQNQQPIPQINQSFQLAPNPTNNELENYRQAVTTCFQTQYCLLSTILCFLIYIISKFIIL